jgi:hypothetical protein
MASPFVFFSKWKFFTNRASTTESSLEKEALRLYPAGEKYAKELI